MTSKFDFGILRQLRQRQGLTIARLATLAGVSIAVISKLERNQTAVELDTVFRLARALGMSATDLIALAESPLAQRTQETRLKAGSIVFRKVQHGGFEALLGEAPAGATMPGPAMKHDDNELCWVLEGCMRIALPHETCDISTGQCLLFDGLLAHSYEALEASRFLLLHLRKSQSVSC